MLKKIVINLRRTSAIAMLVIATFSVSAQNTEANSNDTLALSLNKALEVALSESPTIKIAGKEIERVEYARRERVGGLLPNISVTGAYQRALKKQRMILDIPGMPANPDGIEIGQDNTFTGGIQGSLPIIAPALWATLNLSALELEKANESARSSKIALVNSVSKAYYSVLLAQDSYNVIKRSYDNTKTNAEIVHNKFKQGTVSEFEWIRADVQTRNALSGLVSAESAVNLAYLQLKMLMGVDMDLAVKAQGNLADFQDSMYANYMTIDTTTLEKNSDLKQFDIQVKQLEQSRKININSALPTLAASINYQYMSMVNDKQTFTKDHVWFPTSTLGVQLSIPLFQGGTVYNKNKQIKIQQEQMVYQRQDVRRGLELQVIAYLDNMKKAMENIESNKEGMRQAEKALDISHKMYDVGMATFLDLSNSELLYIQSGLAYNQSIYDYVSAKTDLEKLLGQEYGK